MPSQKCPPGQIMRVGYHRKAYTKKDGTDVPATYVKSVCIKDQGKKGKGPKTLPPLDDVIHLRDYGYSYKKTPDERHAALRAASMDNGTLKVLRRLNLIRNYQYIPSVKDVFNNDVDYMMLLYKKVKDSKISKKEQRGGGNIKSGGNIRSGDAEPTTSDEQNEYVENDSEFNIIKVDLPENESKNTNVTQIFKTKEIYDSSTGQTDVFQDVYEKHKIDDMKVVFYTLTQNDADAVLKLDLMYFDSDTDLDTVTNKLKEHQGHLIGVKINDKLEGYCQYMPLKDSTVKIVWFNANKGVGTLLYDFMERFFVLNNYTKVHLIVSLEGSYAIKRLNFWNKMGFTTVEINNNDKKLIMEKDL